MPKKLYAQFALVARRRGGKPIKRAALYEQVACAVKDVPKVKAAYLG